MRTMLTALAVAALLAVGVVGCGGAATTQGGGEANPNGVEDSGPGEGGSGGDASSGDSSY